jgi:hypothetical protein
MLPQSRIVRDLLWIGASILLVSLVPFFGSTATVFVAGALALSFSLGILFSAVWCQYRIYQIERTMTNR